MSKKIIRLCYRKVIDASAKQVWDRYVFDASYAEFLMQAQFYNQEKKYTRFSELLLHAPNADKLHFLVSAAVVGYLQQLNDTMPDISNNLGSLCIPFKNFRFEIIESDIRKKDSHRVAINFFSEPLIWHSTIGTALLVSKADDPEGPHGVLTHQLPVHPFLSIYSIKEQIHDTTDTRQDLPGRTARLS